MLDSQKVLPGTYCLDLQLRDYYSGQKDELQKIKMHKIH